MDWLTILSLLFLGVLLIGVEVVFIPGTTFIGVLGFISSSCGIYFAYTEQGYLAGHLSLIGSISISIILLIIGIKAKIHKRMGLNDSIEGTSPNKLNINLTVGQIGNTTSALRPSGQAIFNETETEVHSIFGFVDSGIEVIITEIKDNKIFVKTKL